MPDKTTGDPRLDRIRRAIADAGPAGLSRTDIANLFGRNLARTLLDELLLRLDADPEFDTVTTSTGGRPSTRYRYTPAQQPAVLNSSLFVSTEHRQEPAA